MPEITYDQLVIELKNKIYRKVYLLMGEETYFIDQITDMISNNILTEDEKAFNFSVYYGKDSDVKLIATNAKRYPMMANYQIILIKEAKDLKKIEELAFYLENPLKSTILVIAYKYDKYDKRKKLYTLCEKHGVVFYSKKLYENKIFEWVVTYLHGKGYTIDPVAVNLLIDFLGTEISKIANELNKLTVLLPVGTKINGDHISQNIGISKEFNIFEYLKALGYRNVPKALQIAAYMGDHPKENRPDSIMDRLFDYFIKILLLNDLPNKSKDFASAEMGINPYFFEDYRRASQFFTNARIVRAIAIIREYDAKIKGIGAVNVPADQLLMEMTCKILM